MTPASTVLRVARSDFRWDNPAGPAAEVRRLVDAATAADGSAPLDEAALLALRHRGLEGSALWLAAPADGPGDAPALGLAWLHDEALDLVVAPTARGTGLGAALAAAAVPGTGRLTAWSHGNHPAAAALAPRFGLARVRDLWVMRRPLSGLPDLGAPADGIDVRAFRVGADEEAFLAVNAAAFAHHPEQGRMTRADLDDRIAEPWFDPAGFLLAWRGDDLLGFHWTKVHAEGAPPFGEVYVVGIAPDAQGGGLGKHLTLAGLHHLAGRGPGEVILYVEADNAPAVAVYERLGFTHAAADTHVMYARD
ncbi:mycothiol synthase [Nocardioides panacis]|uniref:Mycothiol acetyltransferase n=1 Tax=Nocardioides panacis TaxID=2849501 RepID=A0A975Y042_9ACTN|nr:mycothiol synthase [Nocardioides panacis]QWZ08078.1 mycothiol synthase [Nocardioides panacis]